MEKAYWSAISEFHFILLILLAVIALSLLHTVIRLVKLRQPGVTVYIILFLFFSASHFYLLYTLPNDSFSSLLTLQMDFNRWAFFFLGPALIFVFILSGIYRLLIFELQISLRKIFFGLTLLSFLFLFGESWSVNNKGWIVLYFSFVWMLIDTELIILKKSLKH